MPSLSLERLADDYIAHLRVERGLSANTCATYASWLRHYQKWLTAGDHPADLSGFSAPLLRAYLYALSSANLRPRSIRSAFNPLRGLGQYLVLHGVLTENPALLTLPKKDAAVRLTVSAEEAAGLLDAVERLHPASRVPLARAIISTLLFSGVRFQELLDIRLPHVLLSEGALLVASGKGDKSRLLHPPAPCMDAIAAYLAVRGECRHDWLWAYDKARRISSQGIRTVLEQVKAIAGYRGRDNIKPHSLRHNFASRMMDNGAPLKTIQAALGHKDLKTTAIYLHLEEREAAKMAQYALMPQPAMPPQPPPPKRAKRDFVQGQRERFDKRK